MLRHRTSHAANDPNLFTTQTPPLLAPPILPSLYARIMSLRQELSSWISPISVSTSQPPAISSPAPTVPSKLTFPRKDGRPTVITFLRHCGCPFAEKTFLSLRTSAQQHPQLSFIAISHSDRNATDHWLEALLGPDAVEVVVDEEREIYAKWGLGVSGWGHVLSPGGLWSVWKMGREEGIWNRPTESGSRWQTAGSWAVDGNGIVRWGGASGRADEIPDFEKAILALQEGGKTEAKH